MPVYLLHAIRLLRSKCCVPVYLLHAIRLLRSDLKRTKQNCALLTLFTMGEIFIIFLIFSDIFAIFLHMKNNKIGILENDIDTVFISHSE